MQNVEQTIISQYGTAPTLTQLIQNMNGYLDPSVDLDAFYSTVWDIETAVGFGLDVWGKIVGVARNYQIPSTPSYFGFDDGVNDYEPFGQGPLYAGQTQTQTYILPDDQYRTLILVKALANISNCTIPAYNQLLSNLFAGRGNCFVADLGNMQIQYVFEFFLSAFEVALLLQSNALPRPAGVKATAVQLLSTDLLGFKEAGSWQPFGYGTFPQGSIITN